MLAPLELILKVSKDLDLIQINKKFRYVHIQIYTMFINDV